MGFNRQNSDSLTYYRSSAVAIILEDVNLWLGLVLLGLERYT